MSKHVDPLNQLESLGDRPERPDREFSDRLLDHLLVELQQPATLDELSADRLVITSSATAQIEQLSDQVTVLELVEEDNMDNNRNWRKPLIAVAAAAIVLVGGIALFVGRDDAKTTVADVPDSVTTESTVLESPVVTTASTSVSRSESEPGGEENSGDEPPSTSTTVEPTNEDVAFLRLLFEAAGGLEGQTVAQVEDTHPWITFDPLDNDRFLAADLNFFEVVSPVLWEVQDGGAQQQPMAGFPTNQERSGGTFQRDGTILIDPYASQIDIRVASTFVVLGNDGVLLAEVETEVYPSEFVQSQAGRVISLRSDGHGCPYLSVGIATTDGTVVLSEGGNEFARLLIPEPDVAMALPYFPEDESSGCDTTSTVARAWDLNTGEPLPDYPLDGLEIARAAVSSDGTRAVVFGPEGGVWVLSMETGETIATLGTAEAGHMFLPLSINDDGTLVAVAEENGRLTLWHVDSAEIVVKLAGGSGDGAIALGIKAAASMSYDASRAALRSEDEESWAIVSLDPNEWLVSACVNGFTVTDEQREAAGLDPGIAC